MNFIQVLKTVVQEFDSQEISYALIGGFAMSMRGIQRATMDLDLILLLADLDKADAILKGLGYERVFKSENVSHYESKDADWGRIDILHAFRARSLGMFSRAERLDVVDGLTFPVASLEDIIGLKLQALKNDPSRAFNDWLDISNLFELAKLQSRRLDWALLEDYFNLFGFEDKLIQFRSSHESVE